jgi:hypothetical protein
LPDADSTIRALIIAQGGNQVAFEWKENLACTATYKVLEGDKFLDQFEDTEIPFSKAPTVKLKTLRYFPKTTNNPQIIEVLSIEIARKFITHLVKTFTVSKQKANSAQIIQAVADVFTDGDKTIRDLAEVVDDNIRFPDE